MSDEGKGEVLATMPAALRSVQDADVSASPEPGAGDEAEGVEDGDGVKTPSELEEE